RTGLQAAQTGRPAERPQAIRPRTTGTPSPPRRGRPPAARPVRTIPPPGSFPLNAGKRCPAGVCCNRRVPAAMADQRARSPLEGPPPATAPARTRAPLRSPLPAPRRARPRQRRPRPQASGREALPGAVCGLVPATPQARPGWGGPQTPPPRAGNGPLGGAPRLAANLRVVAGGAGVQLDGHTVQRCVQADQAAGSVSGGHPVEVAEEGLGHVVDQVLAQVGP